MNPIVKKLCIALGCVVALALAFSAGRFAAPAKIHVAQVIQTVTVEKVVEKVVTVEAKAVVRYVDRVVTKEGEIREKIVEREVERKKTESDTEHDKAETSEAKTEKLTVNDYPRLTVMVLAGADLNPAWQPIPGAGPLALGVAVNYRIAGPFVVGAFGLHTGVFGIGLGATF